MGKQELLESYRFLTARVDSILKENEKTIKRKPRRNSIYDLAKKDELGALAISSSSGHNFMAFQALRPLFVIIIGQNSDKTNCGVVPLLRTVLENTLLSKWYCDVENLSRLRERGYANYCSSFDKIETMKRDYQLKKSENYLSPVNLAEKTRLGRSFCLLKTNKNGVWIPVLALPNSYDLFKNEHSDRWNRDNLLQVWDILSGISHGQMIALKFSQVLTIRRKGKRLII